MLAPKGTYKPECCFVVTQNEQLPIFDAEDKPTRVVITPLGFYFFFDDRPYDLNENIRLAKKYDGSSEIRRIYHVDDVDYRLYTGRIVTTSIVDDLEKAVKHLQGLDSIVDLLNAMRMSKPAIAEAQAKRKALVDECRLYTIADRVINVVREGDKVLSKTHEFCQEDRK